MTKNIWGTGRIELDEDGESGQDNMFKAHLDQNETTQSASLSPISSPDQNSGTPHNMWSVLFGTQAQAKISFFAFVFFYKSLLWRDLIRNPRISSEEEEEIEIPKSRNSSRTLRTWAVATRRRRRRWTVCYVKNCLIPIPNCHW
jgi:hypothetical protein